MNDFSFDLETLGTDADCYIASIGVCQFDIETGKIGDVLYVTIDLELLQEDRSITSSTFKWWLKQSEEARKALYEREGGFPLIDALYDVKEWIEERAHAPFVWGNGSVFDIAILEDAFKKSKIDIPWKFWNIQDMRTAVRLAESKGFNKKSVERIGEHHNALDDAMHQARVISAAYNIIQ